MCRIANIFVVSDGDVCVVMQHVVDQIRNCGKVKSVDAKTFDGGSQGVIQISAEIDDHHINSVESSIAAICGVANIEVTHHAGTFARTSRKGIPV